MNIIALEKSKECGEALEKHAEALELNLKVFYTYEEIEQWSKADETSIDFIFIAVSPQDESGFETSLRIRKEIIGSNSASVIFLLSEHHDEHYIKSLKYGGGYLLKPFSSDLLLSSIHHYSKLHNLNYLLSQKNSKLLEHQKMMKREHDIVEAIFKKHCQQHLISSKNMKFHISPASVFNGDILLTAQGPSGSLYLAVGDVTGHGLAAAIGALPVYSTFRSMAMEGKNIGSIAAEMNSDLRGLLPDNMMMATTLMELNFLKGQAIIWSGGMPELMIVSKPKGDQEQTIQKIASRHAPLSVLTPDKFRKDVDVIDLQDGDRLYFYTDGIEECRDKDNVILGTQRFQSLFEVKPENIFDHILQFHKEYTESTVQDDDITLAEVIYEDNCDALQFLTEKQSPETLSIPWEIEFSLTSELMKKTDPIAQAINFLNNAIDIDAHQDCISTIISELYNNSVDHGLLELDSDIKNQEDGFMEYYFERKKKLATLEEGNVRIKMQYAIPDNADNGVLTIEINDSGKGFDYQKINDQLEAGDSANLTHGRGIELIKNLSSDLQYSNYGRTAHVSYLVDRSSYRILQ